MCGRSNMLVLLNFCYNLVITENRNIQIFCYSDTSFDVTYKTPTIIVWKQLLIWYHPLQIPHHLDWSPTTPTVTPRNTCFINRTGRRSRTMSSPLLPSSPMASSCGSIRDDILLDEYMLGRRRQVSVQWSVGNHELPSWNQHVMTPPYAINRKTDDKTQGYCDCYISRRIIKYDKVIFFSPGNSLGYLLIYPPQIATVMKPISFCSKIQSCITY